MSSYSNISLVHAAAFFKLNICNIACGTFTGKWTCALPFNRLIYIFQGSEPVSSISHGSSTFRMLPGHWLFIPTGSHTVHEQYDGLYLISLHFNLELITGIECMSGCSGIYMGEAAEAKDDFMSLLATDTVITDIFMLQKLVWDFVQPIAIQESGNILRQSEKLAGFQPLLDDFNRNLYRDRSVAEMAKKMKMGRETFVRKFSSQFGVSPKLFFHRLRAAAAAKELLNADLTIREVAARFNFSSEFYFSRFMKKMTGLSPREYRKRMAFPRN